MTAATNISSSSRRNNNGFGGSGGGNNFIELEEIDFSFDSFGAEEAEEDNNSSADKGNSHNSVNNETESTDGQNINNNSNKEGEEVSFLDDHHHRGQHRFAGAPSVASFISSRRNNIMRRRGSNSKNRQHVAAAAVDASHQSTVARRKKRAMSLGSSAYYQQSSPGNGRDLFLDTPPPPTITTGKIPPSPSSSQTLLLESPNSNHEHSPILSSRSRSSSYSTFSDCVNSSPADLTLYAGSSYQRHHRRTSSNSMDSLLHRQRLETHQLWRRQLTPELKIHIFQFLLLEELLRLRRCSRGMQQLVKKVPIALNCDWSLSGTSLTTRVAAATTHSLYTNHEFQSRILSLESCMFNIAKIRIKSLPDWQLIQKHHSRLVPSLRHVVIWLRKDQFLDLGGAEVMMRFLEACRQLRTLQLRYLYSDSMLRGLSRIQTLRNLHVKVQSEGTISKLVQRLSHLHISLDIDWCLWSEFFELSELKHLEEVSFPCFRELSKSQGVLQYMDPILSVRQIFGKCYSVRHLLFMFHHFPNAQDAMEFQPDAPIKLSDVSQQSNSYEVTHAVWNLLAEEAVEMKLPVSTLRRIDRVFERILADDLNVWDSFLTLIDMHCE